MKHQPDPDDDELDLDDSELGFDPDYRIEMPKKRLLSIRVKLRRKKIPLRLRFGEL